MARATHGQFYYTGLAIYNNWTIIFRILFIQKHLWVFDLRPKSLWHFLLKSTVEVNSTYCVPLTCCSKDCILSAKNAYKGPQFGISWYRYREIPSTFRVCGLEESISRVQSCKIYGGKSTSKALLGWPRHKVRIPHFIYCKAPALNLCYGFTLQCIVPENFHTPCHQRDFC